MIAACPTRLLPIELPIFLQNALRRRVEVGSFCRDQVGNGCMGKLCRLHAKSRGLFSYLRGVVAQIRHAPVDQNV